MARPGHCPGVQVRHNDLHGDEIMDLIETRIANARRAFARVGGVGQVAKRLGYANASFLVQIFGPNPTRAPSEKTMRKIEAALDLPIGSLDWPSHTDWAQSHRSPPAGAMAMGAPGINVDRLGHAIRLMKRLEVEEQVELSVDRLSSLVAMVYEDTAEQGQLREAKWRQVVQLLR